MGTETGASLARVESLLSALLALQLEERNRESGSTESRRKDEVLLADAGLSYQDIAGLLGKNYDAVRKSVQRARSSANG